MASIMNCWTCKEKIKGNRPEDCFFWCTEEHKKEHFEKQKEKFFDSYHEHTSKVKVSFDFSKQDKMNSVRQLEDVTSSNSGKRIYTCKLCGKVGHNSRGCKQK